jgi:hypothetical protein
LVVVLSRICCLGLLQSLVNHPALPAHGEGDATAALPQGDATAALAAIASRNRTHLPEAPLADAGATLAARRGLVDILSQNRLRRRTILMLITWLSVNLVRVHEQLLCFLHDMCTVL